MHQLIRSSYKVVLQLKLGRNSWSINDSRSSSFAHSSNSLKHSCNTKKACVWAAVVWTWAFNLFSSSFCSWKDTVNSMLCMFAVEEDEARRRWSGCVQRRISEGVSGGMLRLKAWRRRRREETRVGFARNKNNTRSFWFGPFSPMEQWFWSACERTSWWLQFVLEWERHPS